MGLEDIKILPNNIEAERHFLSCIMFKPTLINKHSPEIDVFYDRDNRYIWEAIKDLYTNSKTVDIVSIENKLGNKVDTMEEGYLFTIAGYSMTASDIKSHYDIILDKWKQRETVKIGQRIVNKGYDGKEVFEDIKKLTKSISSTDGQVRSYDDQLTAVLEYIMSDEPIDCISTGYSELDDILGGGFRPGQFVVVAGRASMGKTALMMNFANNIAKGGQKKVGYISLEMGSTDLLIRVLSMESAVPFGRIKQKKTNDDDNKLIGDAIEEIRPRKFRLYDDMTKTYEGIISLLRQEVQDNNLDIVFIDYIQLLGGSDDKNRVQVLSAITRGFKMIAGELNIPLVGGSQLSRGVENRVDKRPILADLRESGSLEQDADSVLMIYRESYYDEDTERGDIADICIRKNRNGECTGAELEWVGPTMQFLSKE